MQIELVPKDSKIYNAADAPGHFRGKNMKGQRTQALIYSVYCIEDGMAYCQSWNAITGQKYEELIPVAHLEAITPRK